jgi:uncharacterized membrane protein
MTNTSEFYTSRPGRWITPGFFLLVFYAFGASMMDSFAMYHTWFFVGDKEFSRMHIESGRRIVIVFVLPTLLMTLFLVLQFWHRAKAIPRKLLWVALVCTIIPWLSSAFIQIPMQIKLDQGRYVQLLRALTETDWIRVVPTFILAGVALVMLMRCIERR